ncbi:MAG: hypothetical protein FWC11_02555 [Firmicutes bacterium]|nr:hypothetical protein [Bacillota bacterium]MCL2255720.1 hypothetical protein [Bacillota bacterium]
MNNSKSQKNVIKGFEQASLLFGVLSAIVSPFVFVLSFLQAVEIIHFYLMLLNLSWIWFSVLLNFHIMGLIFGSIQFRIFKQSGFNSTKTKTIVGVIVSAVSIGMTLVFMIVIASMTL